MALPDSFKIHTDFPVVDRGDMFLNLYCTCDSTFTGTFSIRFYKYLNYNDSTLAVSKKITKFKFKKGVSKTKIKFDDDDSGTYYAPQFYGILKKADNVPPGEYKIFIEVKKDKRVYDFMYLHNVDSLLKASSPLRQDINEDVLPESKSFLGLRLKKMANDATISATSANLGRVMNKVDKAAKRQGFTSVHREIKGMNYVDLYFKDWFAGRYEVQKKEPGKPIKNNVKLPRTNVNSITSGLDHPSLFSQYKSANNDKKKNIDGEISLTTNVSNGQQQYSDVDNNYYELRGHLELPVCNLPVIIEGLYTSEDNHRPIKTSYFRVHYDVDKMKSDLSKSVNSYNSKFSETKAQGTGMKQVYGSAITTLTAQKTKLVHELDAEVGDNSKSNNDLQHELTNDLNKQARDTSGLKNGIKDEVGSRKKMEDVEESSSNDSVKATVEGNNTEEKIASRKKNLRDTTEEEQRKIADKRKKIQEIDKKIKKYELLIAQYENTNHFDSLIGYNRTKDIGNQSDMTYRQMAKKSSDLLPDGQAKGFITGITKIDAGMFSKEESKYTMSGQMMKGLDVGYDLGLCEAGLTVGKTQYIGSDGSLDNYTFYSEKITTRITKDHKIKLINYTYSPDRKSANQDAFFNKANVSEPAFFQPVNILSLNYDGTISKFIKIGAESAISMKKSDKSDDPKPSTGDKMAYHFTADGQVPNSAIAAQVGYDRIGLGFVNNTLPVTMQGTDQYKASLKNDFFHSFLTVGVEYDRLIQHNFVSTGTSTKMGFDIKTNSKRYPSLSLSYKPFTTFQSYNDTLAISQRQLVGSVWAGKISYQIKKHSRSLRLSISYNKSSSVMDSVQSGSATTQASALYTDSRINACLSIGTSQITGTNNVLGVVTTPNNTAFSTATLSYSFNKAVSITSGADFAVAGFGLCKYSFIEGVMYQFKNCPLIVRMNIRYTDYELNEGQPWVKLYSGNMDLTYKIKAKMDKKK